MIDLSKLTIFLNIIQRIISLISQLNHQLAILPRTWLCGLLLINHLTPVMYQPRNIIGQDDSERRHLGFGQ